MDCYHCDAKIDKRTEYFELLHYQSGSDPIAQQTFCSSDCLREYLPN